MLIVEKLIQMKQHLRRDLHHRKEEAIGIFGGRVFQIEGTANANTPSHDSRKVVGDEVAGRYIH